MRNTKPYWSFWKIVFAGWIVRYPGTFFRVLGVPVGILLVYLIHYFR